MTAKLHSAKPFLFLFGVIKKIINKKSSFFYLDIKETKNQDCISPIGLSKACFANYMTVASPI
jgi:hypothetical protein